MRIAFLSLFFFLVPLFLSALPNGETIQRGNVTFERSGDLLAIHASDGSIIEYKNFDIGRSESVRFIQSSSSSRVLNRVLSKAPSQIDGSLKGNGQIYLVNPMGIVFGTNAIVDAAKLFAGAARIRDEDFLAKNDAFYDLYGTVVNQGQLTGEEVHLFGASVENLGRIETGQGLVTMLAGDSLLIGEKEGHCFVLLEPNQVAEGGIGASDLIGFAISNKGSIVAQELHLEGNRVEIEGELISRDGKVRILGDEISLHSLKIDATGDSEGGTVFIGGDFQGKGALRRSNRTTVSEDVCIDVSAKKLGDGGTAVIWSDGASIFDGYILARGGIEGGNGGLIETSGKMALGSAKGRVDALAPIGKTGDWLLDPLTITVASSGAGTLVEAADCSDMATALTISNTTINGAMANVLLCATNFITQNSDAPINISAPGVGITYQASLATINSNVTTNGGEIIATTNPTTITNATLNSGSGNLSLSDVIIGFGGAGSTLQVTSGTLTLTGTTTLNNNLTLLSTGGTISTFNITGATKNLSLDAGSTGTVLIGGDTNVNTLTVTNSASTTFVGTTTANSVILTNTTGNVDFSLDVTLGSITTTGNPYSVTFDTGGTVTNAATFLNTGGVSFGTAVTSGNITFTNGLNTNQPSVTTSMNGTVSTTNTPLSLGSSLLLGNTTINTANGALTFNSTLLGAHNLTLNTGTIAPLFAGAINIGDLAGNTSLTINTTGLNSIFSDTLTLLGGLTSNNNVVFNNNVSVGGAVNLVSLTTSIVPFAPYNISFLGGGTVTAFASFLNTGTVTLGSSSLPSFTFANGVSTASGPSSTTVQGQVQVSTAAAPLSFGTTIFETGNNLLMTNNGAMTIGNATLTGNATLQTGGANLATGVLSGPGNFTTSSGSTGMTTIGSLNCSVFTPSNSLSVTVSGPTTAETVNLGGMSNGQSVVFNGVVSISNNLFTSASSYSVAFNAGGTVTPFTNFFNTGGVIFGNSSTSLIAFTNGVDTNFTNVTTQTFGLVQAVSGPITFGVLTLNGNTQIQDAANPILFASTVNGGASLTVSDPGGTVTFAQTVGGVVPLFSLAASGSTLNIGANMTAVGGPINFSSPVFLTATSVISDTNGGISFASSMDGGFGLTLNAQAAGSVTVSGAVGGITALSFLTVNAANQATFGNSINTSSSTGNGGNLAISAGGNIVCSGNITTLGGANGFSGGNVSIASSGGSITVASIDVSGGGGGLMPGGNAGSITLQPAAGFTSSKKLGNYPNGILNIYGSLTALGGSGSVPGVPGTVSLSPSGRSKTVSIATIAGNPGGNDLTVNAGSLIIGPNEATTVFGNIAFNLQNTASVGDLVATKAIVINASTINLIRHQPEKILNNFGILYPSNGLHLIAGDPTLQGSVILTGSGKNPTIKDLSISPQAFQKLLLYGGTVLNYDLSVAPISGIIDWVLRTNYWDATPLIQLPSDQEMLAFRITKNLERLPQLWQIWQLIERTRENPIEEAILRYEASKNIQVARINLPEFESYLKRSKFKSVQTYLSNIRALIAGMNQKFSYRGLNDLFKALGSDKIGEETAKTATSEFFTSDVLEFTKPDSLELAEWQRIVLGQGPFRASL